MGVGMSLQQERLAESLKPSMRMRHSLGAGMQVLTSENVRALRNSILTLTRTMEHIEGISGDVSGLTGDTKVKTHVRQLVEALSRIVAD